MKPFRTNLKLVMKKYFCSLHKPYPGVDYFSNDFILSETIKYIFLYNLNTISFEYIYVFFKLKCYVQPFKNYKSDLIQQTYLILMNRLNIKNVALDLCYLLPLANIYILWTMKSNQEFIIKFSY